MRSNRSSPWRGVRTRPDTRSQMEVLRVLHSGQVFCRWSQGWTQPAWKMCSHGRSSANSCSGLRGCSVMGSCVRTAFEKRRISQKAPREILWDKSEATARVLPRQNSLRDILQRACKSVRTQQIAHVPKSDGGTAPGRALGAELGPGQCKQR